MKYNNLLNLNKKYLKKWIKLSRKYYLVPILAVILIFVGIFVLYKIINGNSIYYYAKVQVSYPASYFSKPDFWLVNSLMQSGKQYSVFGSTEAKLLGIRYYPNTDGTSFNIYLNVELNGGYDKKTKQYTFQRTQIGVGSPITLNFSSTQLYGTVIDLSPVPFNEKYVKKTITLVERGSYYEDDPSAYNDIQVGEKYFDGENNIFQIIGKSHEKNIIPVANILTGQAYSAQITATENIIIKAKIMVLQKDNQLIFAGNQILRTGSKFMFSTSNFDFSQFTIDSIQ